MDLNSAVCKLLQANTVPSSKRSSTNTSTRKVRTTFVFYQQAKRKKPKKCGGYAWFWSYPDSLPVIGFPAVLFQSMPIHVCREICCILESVAPWGCHLQRLTYFWKRQKSLLKFKVCFTRKLPVSWYDGTPVPLRKSRKVPSGMIWVCRSSKMLLFEMLKQRAGKAVLHGCKDIPIHWGENAFTNRDLVFIAEKGYFWC